MEIMPIDDDLQVASHERERMKARIRAEVARGCSNFNKIIHRFNNLSEQYTREYMAELIQEVRADIIAELKDRDVQDEVLTFLEENDELIEKAHDRVRFASEDKDIIAGIKVVSSLRDQRMKFLQYYGALPRNAWGKDDAGKDKSSKGEKEQNFLQEANAAADEIEERTK